MFGSKVMFRKMVGPNASRGQVAVCFSALGIMNAALLWPVALGLFLSGSESVPWPDLPWITLLAAATMLLGSTIKFVAKICTQIIKIFITLQKYGQMWHIYFNALLFLYPIF
jgi:hypothetical protein